VIGNFLTVEGEVDNPALNGKTPAEACGIKIEGENKWKTLIQNASKRVSKNN
jgi:hypothetical protein